MVPKYRLHHMLFEYLEQANQPQKFEEENTLSLFLFSFITPLMINNHSQNQS